MGFAGWLNLYVYIYVCISDTAMPWKNKQDLNPTFPTPGVPSLYPGLAGDALERAGKSKGAYGEQQTWNGGWDTIPIPSFSWQKDWQTQTARNKLLLELQDMFESSADTKPERKELTQGQQNLLRKNCTSFLLGIAGKQEKNPPGFLCCQQEFRGRRDSQAEKRDEVSVRGIPSPGRAEGVFLWVDLQGNPSPSTDIFQDSPILRFP